MAEADRRFRTPLSRARGLGSAKAGVGHFIGQRVTAMALAVLILWGVWAALSVATLPFDAASAWLRAPLHAAPLLLLLAVGFYHVRIGAQVIIEDYVHTPLLKTAALIANLFVSAFAFVLGAVALLKVAFGAAGAL